MARLAVSAGTMFAAIAVTGSAVTGSAMAASAPPGARAVSSPAALTGLACRTLDNCVAIGANSPQMASRLVAERWNGSRWSRSALPLPAGTAVVTSGGVACPAARQCVAVGSAYPARKSGHAIAEYWNGSRWSAGRAATPGDFSTLAAVSCPSAGDCYAVGAYTPKGGLGFDPLIEHWDGRSWHQEAAPAPGGGFSSLTDIACRTATFCAAVGSNGAIAFIERWNGRRWTETRSVAGGSLYGVSCPAVTSCFAVGQAPARTGSLVVRWNGRTWSASYTPVPRGSQSPGLQSVSCASPARCLAVGNILSSRVYVVACNARGWHVSAAAVTGGRLGYFQQVRCLSAASCVALGATTSFAATMRPESAFWNGKSWKVVRTA